jgi:hypothetical protein
MGEVLRGKYFRRTPSDAERKIYSNSDAAEEGCFLSPIDLPVDDR